MFSEQMSAVAIAHNFPIWPMMKVSAQKNEDGKADTAIRDNEYAGDPGTDTLEPPNYS
jgi:hypothetical protein